eukprot:9487573-Ditylum_brightwellii.AAC.1
MQSWWGKSHVTLMWNCFYHVWTARNDILHNSSHAPMDPSTLNKQIQRAYNKLQHQMDTFDTSLFQRPLAACLLTTLQSKIHWLVAVDIMVCNFTK